MARKLAVKRLSAVEIDPSQSHQHEFHAGALRQGLGFGDDKQSGELRLQILRRDGSVVEDTASYTLYDARALNPKRSEWHLYYTSKTLSRAASANDLLVLFRPHDHSAALAGFVVPPGSDAEQRLLRLLDLSADFDVRTFQIVDPEQPSAAEADQMVLALWTDDEHIPNEPRQTADHPLLGRSVEAGRLPSGADMAAAAADLATVSIHDPDAYLINVLDAETRLFFSIEAAIHTKPLQALTQAGGGLPEVLDLAMRVFQARRSRRGRSLQLHFGRLLDSRRIAHTAQCLTEPGETPDFVFPGCAAYHDAHFPFARLRMVACKSTDKERWRQVLNEAVRIPVKYLLTLDAALSAPTIDQMVSARLEPYLPASVIASSYAANPARANLGTVAELLDELEAAIL